ncbi:hypothetical protein BGZ68_005033 [Mortierella alpina]|nr:hypothetical protein BGZ68_005033 [Mortierella alpina]
MGILNTQRVSSVVPGTETDEIFIEATEYSPGKFCCDVDSIGEQLGIDRAIALEYHVNGKEAEFITYGENTDYLKLKFYPGMTIVVSEYHSQHSLRKSPVSTSSTKEEHIAAHVSEDGYYCNVFEIEQRLGLDATKSRTYKVRGVDAEFKRDKSNNIDHTKIKFYPDEAIEISECAFVAPTEMQQATMGSSSSSSWESDDSDSLSTGHSSLQEVPQAGDEDAEWEFLNLLATGSTSNSLRAVTLSLTGAAIMHKVFDALASLPCLTELSIALAWTFRRRDLNAVVEKLNQLSVQELTLNFKDKKEWKRPQVFGHNGQPLEAFRLNPQLRSFHLIGASRFEIRVEPQPEKTPSNLQELHLRIPIDDKYDQAAVQHIIEISPQLVDLRLGGIYKSEMHEALADTIGELKQLEILHLYGMERNELGGPILDLLGGATNSAGLLRELVLVDSKVDAIETQALVRKCEHSLTALVLDHAAFQPLNLKFFCNKLSSRPMLQNLTNLHLHVDESAESLRMLANILKGLSLTHLGLTQSDPEVVSAELGGKSLLHHVNFASMKSLFLSGFTGPCLVPLWKSVERITGGERLTEVPSLSANVKSPLEYLSIEYLSKCPDLPVHLRQFNLKSLWIVADVKALECEFDQMALSLDYSSLEKVALFRISGRDSPKLESYFWGLEGHLLTHEVKDLTIRVGDFEEHGSHRELSGHKVLTYVVDKQGELRRGASESARKDINPRYHRCRWGMTGWSV